MVQVDNLKIRFALSSDGKHLAHWLDDEQILKWFPMCNKVEIADSVKVWMSYSRFNAVLTAEIDGKPCGIATLYLQAFKKISHQCLFAIIVSKEYRSKGIGTALMKDLFKLAKDRFKLELLHLEVYETNPAYALYKKLGFEEYGVHKKFLKEDGKYYDKILMQKKL